MFTVDFGVYSCLSHHTINCYTNTNNSYIEVIRYQVLVHV